MYTGTWLTLCTITVFTKHNIKSWHYHTGLFLCKAIAIRLVGCVQALPGWSLLEKTFSEKKAGKMKLHLHLVDTVAGIRVLELKRAILQQTLKLSHIRCPTNWQKIQSTIGEHHSQPQQPWYMGWDQFQREICKDIPNADKAVSSFWEPLGVCLRYSCHGQEDMVVVRPQELCNVFKCVITQHRATQYIKDKGGYADRKLLSNSFIAGRCIQREWSNEKIEETLDFFIQLLADFELAIQYGDNGLLFPHLMPSQCTCSPPVPEHTSLPPATPNLSRVYFTLSFVPASLFGGIVCRVLQLKSSDNELIFERQCLWNTGIVLDAPHDVKVKIQLVHSSAHEDHLTELQLGELQLSTWGEDTKVSNVEAVQNQVHGLLSEIVAELFAGISAPKRVVPCTSCHSGRIPWEEIEARRKRDCTRIPCQTCHQDVSIHELLNPKSANDPKARSEELGVSANYICTDFESNAKEAACEAARLQGEEQNRTGKAPDYPVDEDNPSFLDIAPDGVMEQVFSQGNHPVFKQGFGPSSICPRDGKQNCSVVDAFDQEGGGEAGNATHFLSWVATTMP